MYTTSSTPKHTHNNITHTTAQHTQHTHTHMQKWSQLHKALHKDECNTHPWQWSSIVSAPGLDVWRGEDPFGHIHSHGGDVWRERGANVLEDREEGGLATPLKPYNHQLHVGVRDAVPQLGPKVCQEVFGGSTMDSWEEVVGDVGHGDSIEGNLPAVMEVAQLQWKIFDVCIATGSKFHDMLFLAGRRKKWEEDGRRMDEGRSGEVRKKGRGREKGRGEEKGGGRRGEGREKGRGKKGGRK